LPTLSLVFHKDTHLTQMIILTGSCLFKYEQATLDVRECDRRKGPLSLYMNTDNYLASVKLDPKAWLVEYRECGRMWVNIESPSLLNPLLGIFQKNSNFWSNRNFFFNCNNFSKDCGAFNTVAYIYTIYLIFSFY